VGLQHRCCDDNSTVKKLEDVREEERNRAGGKRKRDPDLRKKGNK
jgi:hypothetical protein